MTTTDTRRRRQQTRLRDDLAALEIRVRDALAANRELAADLIDALALGARHLLNEPSAQLLMQAAACWPELDETTEALETWRDALADVSLVEALREATLGAWIVDAPGGRARRYCATSVGLEPLSERDLDAVMMADGEHIFVDDVAGTPAVGWWLERDDLHTLVVLGWLDDEATDEVVEALEEAADVFGDDATETLQFGAVAEVLLLAVLDAVERQAANDEVEPSGLDRRKIKVLLEELDADDLRDLVEHAVDMLPDAQLPALLGSYASWADLTPDTDTADDLRDAVHDFFERSMAGEFYESFNVNSRNYMQQSAGTRRWIAECNRLVDACLEQARRPGHEEVVIFGLGALYELLRATDDDRVIFFADEGGAWQVGVDENALLDALYRCLASTTSPDDYALYVEEMTATIYPQEREAVLAAARKAARTRSQRDAIAGL